MATQKSSASSRRVASRATKRSATRARLINGRLVPLQEPTEKQLRHLQALSRRPQTEIDLSDIPELPASAWRQAMRGGVRPKKQQITVRLDADLLEWLKGLGKGYQTKMNSMLRAAMKAAKAG